MRWIVTFGVCVVGTALAGGCEPLPANDGQFWTGKTDSGVGVTPGSGGSPVDPMGSGGSVAVGSGGVPGSGGVSGTGGAGNDFGSGGLPGTGGTGSGSGGLNGNGTGGGVAVGGTLGAGGGSNSGGRPASGGSTNAGGRGAGGSVGASGSGGAIGMGGSSGALTGTLKVSVTTKSAGGRYAPDNVGAIWIADSGTKFVKSLYVWGSQRRRELSTWTSATSAAGLANNLVDAVTAATMHSHGVRTATWNGTNAAKSSVPDGAYKVCFELRDGSGQSQCVDFNKSRSPQTSMPADTTTFTKRSLEYTP